MFRALFFVAVVLCQDLRGSQVSDDARKLFPLEGRQLYNPDNCWMCEYGTDPTNWCVNQDCQIYNGQCISKDWLPYATWDKNAAGGYTWTCLFDGNSAWQPYWPTPVYKHGNFGDIIGMACIPSKNGQDHCPSPDSFDGFQDLCGGLMAAWVQNDAWSDCWAMCTNPQGMFQINKFAEKSACYSPDGTPVRDYNQRFTSQCLSNDSSGSAGFCAYPTKADSSPRDGRLLSQEDIAAYRKLHGLNENDSIPYDRALHGEVVPLDEWESYRLRRLEEGNFVEEVVEQLV